MLDTDRFIADLIQDAGRKVFLIIDNLKVNHGKHAKEWLAGRDDQFSPARMPVRPRK